MPESIIDSSENQKLRVLVRNCLIFSLLWHLIATWFSIGYHQPDEHFQIIEFASYKLGITPASALPWEFGARIRPALQPAMVVLLEKYGVPSGNPFQVAFLLRLFSSLFGFGSLVFMLFVGLKMVKDYEAQRFLILLSTLLWFVPYMHAHFSAEVFSGSLFFYGLGCIYIGQEKDKKNLLVLGGFLIGLAFVCRPQTGFMLLGLAIWCVFVAKMKISKLFMIGIPLVMTFLVGMGMDRWFYGEWVNTTLNYFKVNIIQGKAAEFGVSPWYTYFIWGFTDLIPPFSILIIAGIIYSLIKYRANIFSLSIIPFLLAHILLSHKEPRFLFPIVAAIPVLVALAYKDWFIRIFKNIKWRKWILNSFFWINIILMAITCLKPASDRIGLYEYIWRHYNGDKAVLLCKEDNPYSYDKLNVYFYRPADMEIQTITTPNGMDSTIEAYKHSQILVLFDNQDEANGFVEKHPSATLVYSSFPPWVLRYNYNHWENRTKAWSLYEVK